MSDKDTDLDDLTTAQLSEAQVSQYLRDNPAFFVDHPTLLAELKIPHRSGEAVSLVERQIAVLRQQSQQQQEQLAELLEIAHDNDRLNEQLHHLTLLLLECEELEGLLELIGNRLQRDYSADAVRLHLTLPPRDAALAERAEFVADPATFREPFERLLHNGNPFCGRLKDDKQLQLVFGEQADDIGSVALIPLGGDGRIGLLAIGSGDGQRFSPGGDTTFLGRMAQIIAAALSRHLISDND